MAFIGEESGLKVVHINGFLAPKGGVETYLQALLPHLKDAGLDQSFIYGIGDAALWPGAIRVPSLMSLGPAAERQTAREVSQTLSDLKPDLIHVHNVQNFAAIQSAWECAPTILTLHDYRYLCPSSNFYYRRTRSICDRKCGLGCFVKAATHRCMTPRPHFALNFYRRVRWMSDQFHRLAHVISPCRYGAQRLEQAGCSPNRISVVPYFCPLKPADAPRPVPVRPTVLFIGRLAENKGVDVFIEAIGKLPKQVRGVVVGNLNQDTERKLRHMCRKAGCEDRMTLRAWAAREEIQGIMNQSSVMVFPSLWAETLGIVGLESLASGVPVVASDVGGIREWLIPDKTGVLVQPGDSGQLADGISSILQSPQKLMEFGRNGIQLIRDRFLVEQHVSKLLSIYQGKVRA